MYPSILPFWAAISIAGASFLFASFWAMVVVGLGTNLSGWKKHCTVLGSGLLVACFMFAIFFFMPAASA